MHSPRKHFAWLNILYPSKQICQVIQKKRKDTQGLNKDEDNFSDIEDWDGDLEKWKHLEMQELKTNDTPQPSPKSISTSDAETLIPQPSRPFIDSFGKQISVSSEEGQKEENFEVY